MWLSAEAFEFLVDNIPQSDGSPYTPDSVAMALQQAGLADVDKTWVQKAITVGIDAPDAYAAVILDLFGILTPDYFIDPASMSRVQRQINSLRLMAKLGIRSVPRIHAYYGDGRACKWLQSGDLGFDKILLEIHARERASATEDAGRSVVDSAGTSSRRIARRVDSARHGLLAWLHRLFP